MDKFFIAVFMTGMAFQTIWLAVKCSDYEKQIAHLEQQIETTKQCLRNSMYEEWELCFE